MNTRHNIPHPSGKQEFKVPDGYFESLSQRIQERIKEEGNTAKKDVVLPTTIEDFKVPDNYFNQLEQAVLGHVSQPVAKKRHFYGRWIGWAVAASVLWAVVVFLPKKATTVQPSAFELAIAQTDLEMDEFISALTDEELEYLFMEEVNAVEYSDLGLTQVEVVEQLVEEEKFSDDIKPSPIEDALMNEELTEEDVYDYLLDEASEFLFE